MEAEGSRLSGVAPPWDRPHVADPGGMQPRARAGAWTRQGGAQLTCLFGGCEVSTLGGPQKGKSLAIGVNRAVTFEKAGPRPASWGHAYPARWGSSFDLAARRIRAYESSSSSFDALG